MHRILLPITLILWLATSVPAADIPWNKFSFSAIRSFQQLWTEYGKSIDKEKGRLNVYQLPPPKNRDVNGYRDSLGNADQLGQSTELDAKSKAEAGAEPGYLGKGKFQFEGTYTPDDDAGTGGVVQLAVLADDTATVTVYEGTDDTGSRIGSFSVNGGALWKPASFAIGSFSLNRGTTYFIRIDYQNRVNVKYKDGSIDVDGISLWAVGSTGIHHKWQLASPGGNLDMWHGGNKVFGYFSGKSGWPEYRMHTASTYGAGTNTKDTIGTLTKREYVTTCYTEVDANKSLKHHLRYLPTAGDGDDVHHILPKAGPRLGTARQGELYNKFEDVEAGQEMVDYFNALRAELSGKGIDVVNDAPNLVALPRRWHRKNTLRWGYYKRVQDAFGTPVPSKTKAQYEAILNSLADQLLKESGKIK